MDELELIPKGESADPLVQQKKKKSPVSSVIAADDLGDLIIPTGKDDFIWDAMQRAYDPLTNTVRDLKIDDSDLPRAKNYYDFCVNVAGSAIKSPFSRQLWIAYHLFGEYCTRCTPIYYDDINNIPVDMESRELITKVTLLENGCCPKCGVSKAHLVINKELVDYNQLVMVAGQRGGKSALSSTMAAYHLHLMLKAPRMSSICRGIQDFTPLTGTFVALSLTRSVKLLWNPFSQIIDASSWFNNYLKLLDHAGKQYGKEFYRKSTLYMRFFNRNLDLYPMGPMKRTLRGDTRFFACLSGSTPVMTDKGWKRIGDESILGTNVEINGESHPVTRWIPQGVKQTYLLLLNNGLSLYVTLDHNVRVYDSMKSTLKWVEVGKLTLTDWIVCHRKRPSVDLHEFPADHPMAGNFRYLGTMVKLEKHYMEPVFDITVDSEDHAFNANGIEVKNCTDELGWFPYKETNYQDQEEDDEHVEDETEDERERANGDEVHQSLDNSLATVRAEVWDLYRRNISSIPTGLNVNISSPQSWKDKICRLLKESDNPAALSLGVHLPTWGISPLFSRDHPIIQSAFAKNERRADRDYGANPPKLSATLFIKEAVQASFSGKQHHAIVYDADNPEYTVGKIKELVVKNKWEALVMGIDAGLNNNSFALTIGSRTESSVTAYSSVELIPSKQKPVFFPALYKDVLLPLIRQCNIVYVGADRWNSIHLLQQIEEDTKGRTKTMTITLNVNHFNGFKELVNSGCLTLPALDWSFDGVEQVLNYKRELKGRPIEHLYLQFLTVRESLGGIGKGEGNTDDLWRSLVVMSSMLFIPKVKSYLEEFKPVERAGNSNRSLVLTAGKSGFR